MPGLRSSAVVSTMRRPSVVKIKNPLGCEPNTSCGGPLSTMTCQEISFQVPTGLFVSVAEERLATASTDASRMHIVERCMRSPDSSGALKRDYPSDCRLCKAECHSHRFPEGHFRHGRSQKLSSIRLFPVHSKSQQYVTRHATKNRVSRIYEQHAPGNCRPSSVQ